ncbi:unnamed protein product, partial [Polarella glacialis]
MLKVGINIESFESSAKFSFEVRSGYEVAVLNHLTRIVADLQLDFGDALVWKRLERSHQKLADFTQALAGQRNQRGACYASDDSDDSSLPALWSAPPSVFASRPGGQPRRPESCHSRESCHSGGISSSQISSSSSIKSVVSSERLGSLCGSGEQASSHSKSKSFEKRALDKEKAAFCWVEDVQESPESPQGRP